MNTSHDKSLAEHHPRSQFELTPLDNRRHQPDHPHHSQPPHLHQPQSSNYRDSNYDHHLYRPQPRNLTHPSPPHPHHPPTPSSTSHPMKTSVMHHQQHSAPLASIQTYSSSASIAFSSLPDAPHSSAPSFPTSTSAAHPAHLPTPISLHQPVHHPHPPHPPHQHPPHQHPPPRPDVSQKMPPPQHQTIRRVYHTQRQPQQLLASKPADHIHAVSQATILPHMNKVPQSNVHIIPQQAQQQQQPVPPRFQPQVASQSHLSQTRPKGEALPSVPLPMHPDPIQPFQPAQDPNDAERGFSFSRHGFFDDLPQEDNPNPVGLPPPHGAPDSEQGNTLAGVDSLTGHLGMPGVASISSLPLPGISGGQSTSLHAGFGAPASLGNAAIVGGASEIAEALGVDRKGAPLTQRRIRPVPRVRHQQMTESQRKQRHNEHTRASRSRIDRGLERLKNTIRKVRPHQKVTKKADVLQEAVKLLKEGFRLPPTESDDERDDPPQDSSLSV